MKSKPEKGNAPEVAATGASSVNNQDINQGFNMSDSKAQVQKSITFSSEDAGALSFNGTVFNVVEHTGQAWLKAVEIGRALGYVDDKAIQRIYARHSDEFTKEMTGVVNLTTPSGRQDSRVFSLRGAHLLAMFARTKVAKAFRKWVLDVLDREVQRQAQKQGAATALTPSHDGAFAGLVIAARRKMVATLEDFERQMAVWEIVDEEADKSMPNQQMQEIRTRIERLGKLFHPFSDQFVDVLGISRALRGLDPRMGGSMPGWVEVL